MTARRRPRVRTTEVACGVCGFRMDVHLPPLVYYKLGMIESPWASPILSVTCPDAECGGRLTITVGDAKRAA